MKIMIMTLGTLGDVQPYVALGKGLQAAGDSVTLCTAARFQPFVEEQGLTYGYMHDEILALIDSEEIRAMMGGVTNALGAMRMAVKTMGQVGPLQKMMVADSWEATRAADPDLILFHPKAYGGAQFAEKLEIPSILAPTLPQFAATSDVTAMGFPALPLGGWYNRLSYNLVVRLTAMGVGGYMNDWRKANGLKPQTRGTDFIRKQQGEPIPVIHPLSRHVIDVPADWPPYVHAAGYWFLDEPSGYQPPADLTAFLDQGEPPVYIGFGSMVGADPRTLTETIIAGVEQAGVRAVLASGWGGLAAESLPESIHMIGHAPHSWLFPRMRAVVHHGGAGTTAAGLRAGRPTLVCPYFGDQPFWGERVQAIGAGPAPVHQKKLTVETLAESLRDVAANPRYAENAARIGEQLRAEDGVGNAVAIIHAHAAAWENPR